MNGVFIKFCLNVFKLTSVFGGVFETEAEYREKEVQDLIKEKEGRIYWPLIRYSHDTVNLNLNQPAPSPPTLENLLGTDDQARDVLARVIYGFRISILFGLILTILSSDPVARYFMSFEKFTVKI